MEHRTRTRLVAALVLACVFASGILLGFAADRAVAVASVTSSDAPSGERPRRVPVYELMSPTDEQRVVLDSIMREHRAEMNRLHADFEVAQRAYNTSYDALIQETRDALAAVFPPEQRAEYRRLLAENDRRRAAERASGDAAK
jgi:cell division septation protein DedD